MTIDTKPREARENYLGALRIAEEIGEARKWRSRQDSDDNLAHSADCIGCMGGVEGRLRDAKVGEQYFGKAQTIAEEMLRGQPDDNGRKQNSAISHERIGDLLLRNEAVRRRPTANTMTAALLFKAIADSDPKNVDAQADHSRILYSQGLAAERIGDKAGCGEVLPGVARRSGKNRINLNNGNVRPDAI